MQVNVKSVKVLKSGTNKNGEWELVGVTSEDGTNYTTFHKSAKNLTAGSVIEFEPEIKEGKISFKEYKVVSEAPAPASPSPANGKPDSHQGMTPEMWAEKDRLERWSIESQTAFKGIMEFASKHETPNHISGKFGDVFDAALDWAMAHFKTPQPTTKPSPPPTKSKSDAVPDDLSAMVFNNAGELKTACKDVLKMTPMQISKETAGFILTTPEGRAQAWQAVVSLYGAKDEKSTTETRQDIDPDNLFE